MGLTALLSIAVVMMMLADTMPRDARSFPRLGWYVVAQLTMIGGATLVSAIILHAESLALHFDRKRSLTRRDWKMYFYTIDMLCLIFFQVLCFFTLVAVLYWKL